MNEKKSNSVLDGLSPEKLSSYCNLRDQLWGFLKSSPNAGGASETNLIKLMVQNNIPEDVARALAPHVTP